MPSLVNCWRGRKPKPQAEITVFKSLGLAVEDLAAAKLVLKCVPALVREAAS